MIEHALIGISVRPLLVSPRRRAARGSRHSERSVRQSLHLSLAENKVVSAGMRLALSLDG